MRWVAALLLMLAALPAAAAPPLVVTIPYMEREAPHRNYADQLLALALKLSSDRYGPFRIVQQRDETVIRRQLLELGKGSLSVAVAMPTPEWLDGALPVRVPIMRGLASFRYFLGRRSEAPLYDSIKTVDDLRALTVGQGPGWSTAKILEDNGFKVVYGGAHPTLIPMLGSGRFQLLMRSAYEVEPELRAQRASYPDLMIVDNFAVFTYMPMYFFVAKGQPLLAERLEYGLKKAYANGQLDLLFNRSFGDSLKLLRNRQTRFLSVPNTNIDPGFFERDRPYLLAPVVTLETEARRKR
ncbi:substrate-binding periplasmic protein [Roseateles sp. BYS78W]|uniref:Substrate-binding periplasmic protein n=1 Tax=Pelomonas candidula TaxID=3299025 RepID=A0ABW7HDB1_9BURK